MLTRTAAAPITESDSESRSRTRMAVTGGPAQSDRADSVGFNSVQAPRSSLGRLSIWRLCASAGRGRLGPRRLRGLTRAHASGGGRWHEAPRGPAATRLWARPARRPSLAVTLSRVRVSRRSRPWCLLPWALHCGTNCYDLPWVLLARPLSVMAPPSAFEGATPEPIRR
jgi:hypothetical protein